MAFMIHAVDGGFVPPIEYLPVSAITPKVGLALAFSSGNLAVATGTTKPEYISMADKNVASSAGDLIPVIRVCSEIVFEVPAQAAMTSVALGTKVTLHTDGLQVTATTTSGIAKIVGRDGTAAGAKQLVRFE